MEGHVKILLRKDYFTLRRNFVFLAMFVFLPCMLMLSFGKLQDSIGTEYRPE